MRNIMFMYEETLITLSPAGVLKFCDAVSDVEKRPAASDVPETPVLSVESSEKAWEEQWFCMAAQHEKTTSAQATSHTAAVMLFWRQIADACIVSLCHVSNPDAPKQDESQQVTNIPLPDNVDRWLVMAPPMQGGEYLSRRMLADLWQKLLQWCAEHIQKEGSVYAFLQTWAPKWQQVGRVFFHLAENKMDETRPFAFLATYTIGLNDKGQPRHVPLAHALQHSAAEKDAQTLVRLLDPVHLASQKIPWIARMVQDNVLYQATPLTVQNAYAFLESIPSMESCGLGVRMPDWWKKRPKALVQATVDVPKNAALGVDALLDLDIHLALGDSVLSPEEMDQLLAMANTQLDGAGLVFFKNAWVEVDTQKLQQALNHWKSVKQYVSAGNMNFIQGMRLLAGMSDGADPLSAYAAYGEDEDLREWAHVHAGPELEKFLSFTRQEYAEQPMRIDGLTATLRPYQVKGVQWLRFVGQLGLGACLADDMGLGKTLQILALLLWEKNTIQAPSSAPQTKGRAQKKSKPQKAALPPQTQHADLAPMSPCNTEQADPTVLNTTLLIVPASLLGNWQAEIAAHAPHISAVILHPSVISVKNADLEHMHADLAQADLVITTYGMCQRLTWLAQVQWKRVIADEAQAIKNAQTRQSKAVRALKAHTRIALTGTPIENSLADLWALFNFLNPGLLGSVKNFTTYTKKMAQSAERFAPLRRLVSPYILRRMKTDKHIIQDLPDKTEMPLFCHLTKEQAQLYTEVTRKLKTTLQSLDNAPENQVRRRGIILQTIILLKQICNHPHQAKGHSDAHALYATALSGKFQRIAELCANIAERQERVLVFSQFKEIIAPLYTMLEHAFGRQGLVLHGGIAVKKRQELVSAFQKPDGPPFFVLSLKAGGTGLTLTQASHVIHVDRWWNPAVENQATDRAFRIGQKRNVLVHKCVTRGTLEEKIDALIEDKKHLSDEVLGTKAELDITSFDDKALLDFVRLDLSQLKSD